MAVTAWGPSEWEALGLMIQGVATGGAALGAALTYRNSKRSESLRWTDDHIRETLLNPEATVVRTDLEFRYWEHLENFVTAQLAAESPAVLTEDEVKAGARLDSLLISLEHLLLLRDEKAIRSTDLEADFSYWTGQLLSRSEYASLRLYLAEFGFHRLAESLPREDQRRLAVYGTLRRSSSALEGFESPDMSAVERSIRVPGVMYDAGDYPAAVVDLAAVHGRAPVTSTFEVDVMRIEVPHVRAALRDLDAYEEVDRYHRRGLYRRVFIPVGDGGGAWVYHWNRPVDRLPLVSDGVWS